MMTQCEKAQDALNAFVLPSDLLEEDIYLTEQIKKHVAVAACHYDTAKGCVSVSDNWHDITGLSSRHSLGYHWHCRMRHQGFARFCNMLDHTQEGMLPRTSVKIQMRDGYGTWRWYEISAIHAPAYKTGYGKHFVLLIRDVEKEMVREAEWQKLSIEAALASRSRSEFLANMSHELRTPLNAIIGFAQMISQETFGALGNSKYQEYIQCIHESGTSLLNKVSDIMEMAEAESGRIQLSESFANINEIIEDALSSRYRSIQAKHIRISKHIEHRAMLIRCDRIKITRALSHLLTNAITNSPEGSEIVVRSQRINKGVVLYISDNGRGIDQEHLAIIKNGLQQPHTLFATEPNGIRIGLALAKEFLALHQAEIDIESRLGSGTLVCVTIPNTRIVSVSATIKEKHVRRAQYKPLMAA